MHETPSPTTIFCFIEAFVRHQVHDALASWLKNNALNHQIGPIIGPLFGSYDTFRSEAVGSLLVPFQGSRLFEFKLVPNGSPSLSSIMGNDYARSTVEKHHLGISRIDCKNTRLLK